ncbi:AAA family ATPase [Gordonibacter sp. 28C]|uniref:AAA family ATPase n=1 Tax=Gordonibacter sp. 28C TaxID=2078569 RepID=UPI000DF800ED|nr:AAA family ATPase [Gordonibacter sp. 28C]
MSKVLHIFGASGSGTTTLGEAISEAYDCHFIDVDDCYWLPTDPPFRRKRPREERLAMIVESIDSHKRSVVSGSLCGWGDSLIPRFDAAVRIEANTSVRIDRLERRERCRFGSRIDAGGDMYAAHRDFIAWAKSYDTADETVRGKALHDTWQKLLCCPLAVVDGARDTTCILHDLKALLGHLFTSAPTR